MSRSHRKHRPPEAYKKPRHVLLTPRHNLRAQAARETRRLTDRALTPPPALYGELTDPLMYRILGVLGLTTADARAAAVGLSARRWCEVERFWPMRRRDPWLARFTPGPRRAGAVPPDTPLPDLPHEDAPVAFPHLADLPELGHRWTPRRPPCD